MDNASNFELEPEMQMENFVSQCSVNSSVTQLLFPRSLLPLYIFGWFCPVFIAVNMRNGNKVSGRAHQADHHGVFLELHSKFQYFHSQKSHE